MSGGYFEYNQYRINDIIDSIERELNAQGKEKHRDELYSDKEFYEKYPEEKYYYTYPIEVQEKFKEAIRILKLASIYTTRIDWLLSGDDGEESFLKRLKEEINELNAQKDKGEPDS